MYSWFIHQRLATMVEPFVVKHLVALIRRGLLSTIAIDIVLLHTNLIVMADAYGANLGYPHIDLVENVITIPRDFGGNNAAFVKASNWFIDKLLSESLNELAPYLVCAEWGRGREALGALEETFSPESIYPLCHCQDHGSCFVVSASPEMFTSGILDVPGLISSVPLHPCLKPSPDLPDHKLEEASSREDVHDEHDSYTPLHTTSGETMKQHNTHGLTVRLTPGALPMHSERPPANGVIGNVQEILMSTDFDMNTNNYWSNTERSHPECRSAYLAREWSRAASLVQSQASDRQELVVDTSLDETSCFFSDEDGLQVEHGHLFHGLRLDPDGPIQGLFVNWTLVQANVFPYDMSRRKVVQYIELLNTGDQADGEGKSFGSDDPFYNFSEYYYFDNLDDDTVLGDYVAGSVWWTPINSVKDLSSPSYTSTYTSYSSSENPCEDDLEDNSDYSDYFGFYSSVGGFHKDRTAGHGTRTRGTAAGNVRNSSYAIQSCPGEQSEPACAGGCISPEDVTDYLANGVFDTETNCPAYECDGEGLDSPSCLGEDVIETLLNNDGIAPEAQIAFFDVSFTGSDFNIEVASNFLWDSTFGTGAMIHSNSWGASTRCQATDIEFMYDTFMYENPEHLLIFASGNEGGLKDLLPEGGCTIASPALGKNVLAVGSTSAGASSPTFTGTDGRALYDELGLSGYNPDGFPWMCLFPTLGMPSTSTEPADIDMLSFSSSYGPTLDERIKPGVVAPGDQLLSASSDGTVDHSCEMFYSSGTSMATPLVACAAAIVRQYFRDPSFYVQHLEAKGFCESGSIFSCSPFSPSAATVKAMMINSANLMEGASEPNDLRGFGRVHLEAGLPLGSNDSLVLFVAEASLDSSEQTKYAFELNGKAGLYLRASLSWLGIPTTAMFSLQLQHDLDLSITSHSDDIYTMWTAGAKDTVNENERVIVRAGSYEDGIYTATISAGEFLTESQTYSLVVTGAILDGRILDEEATCSNGLPGVQLEDVCCGEECGICGGNDCGSRPGGNRACCSRKIRASGITCSESGAAPCIIATCSNGLSGLQLEDVCCREECGACGGSGCGSRPGGKNVCCSSTIRDSGIVCSESGAAPCIIG